MAETSRAGNKAHKVQGSAPKCIPRSSPVWSKHLQGREIKPGLKGSFAITWQLHHCHNLASSHGWDGAKGCPGCSSQLRGDHLHLGPCQGIPGSPGCCVSSPPPKGCVPWEQSQRQRGSEAGCAASVWNGFFITVLISQSVALHENKALDRTGKKGLWRQHANIATSLKQNNPKKSVSRGRGRALPTGWRVQRLPFNHHFCRWGFLFVCPFHWLIYFIIILLLLTFFSPFFFFFFSSFNYIKK